MKVELRYFASIRETVGVAAESVETTAGTLAALRDELIALDERHAQALARGRALRMALNQVMCRETASLLEGAEVAFFPPVTGG
ncbi:MAG: molybdopterin converting factor subunit 1 [Comamonadaceae bacterium]|jgi:sulfur-carrier protein